MPLAEGFGVIRPREEWGGVKVACEMLASQCNLIIKFVYNTILNIEKCVW